MPLPGLSLQPLRPFLAQCWDPQGSFPEAALQKLQDSVLARVAFPVVEPSHMPPDAQLHMPVELEAVMGESCLIMSRVSHAICQG